ncbi:MAG: ADP-ribosylation factor-like protein [Candidatus Hodarchaeales archaeon]
MTRKLYKIALAGLSHAGKTSILSRLLTGRFIQTEPTKGFDTELLERENVQFQVIDLGGQDVFIHTLWKAFLPQADVFIFVIDANDSKNFAKARDVLHFSIGWNPDMPMLVIFANKQDLPSAAGVEEVLELLNVPVIIAENNIKQFRIFGTSAKTGTGIEEAFNWLAKELTKQYNIPSVDLKNVYVYRKSTSTLSSPDLGPCIASHEMNGSGSVSQESLMQQMIANGIQSMEMEDSSGVKNKLVMVENEIICSFLLADANDDVTVIRAIGEELIHKVKELLDNRQLVSERFLEDILTPFTRNHAKWLRVDSDVTEKKTVLETVSEKDTEFIRKSYDKGKGTFFTKMSVLDRIRTIENK